MNSYFDTPICTSEKWGQALSRLSLIETWRSRLIVSRHPYPFCSTHPHNPSLSSASLQWLKDPGPRTEKRTLCCDMVCFVFITPLAAISGWLCLRGAQDHLRLHSRLEAVGLIALTIALFTIYVLWTLVSGESPCGWAQLQP